MGLPEPYYEEGEGDRKIVIYHDDCRAILPELPAGSADLVLTDPPYGLGMRSHTDQLSQAIAGMNQACGTKAITFMSPRQVVAFVAGCTTWQFLRLLWWNKTADIGYPWRGWYMNSEAICVFGRNGAAWPRECRYHSDLYQSGPEPSRPSHAAWKPVGLLQSLIQHTRATRLPILDPFMGTGPVLLAAKLEGCGAIGIDIEEWCCEIAAKRLAQGVFEFTDPQPPDGSEG